VYSGYDVNGWHQSFSNSAKLTNNQSANPRLKITDFATQGNTLQLGYDWSQTNKSNNGYLTYGSLDGTNPGGISQVSNNFYYRTNAFYLRDTLELTRFDKITIGYRKQTYLQNYDDLASLYTWQSRGNSTANEIQYTKTLTPVLASYIRISQNFRLPNVDDNNGSANWTPGWLSPIPLLPQTSHDIDIGLNYRSTNYLAEVNYFHNNVKNEIGYDPGQFGNVNYDPTRREGVSLKQKFNLSQKIAIGATFQYINAKFIDGTYSGNVIPNVASFSGNISFDYQMTPNEKIALTSRFANSRYMSGDFPNSQSKVPGYVVGDVSYFYIEKNWSLIASANNIFNKQYTDTGIYKSSYYDLYKLTVYPNPGRNFSLMGRYSF
jgi:iron complex outermembrane receptor protein